MIVRDYRGMRIRSVALLVSASCVFAQTRPAAVRGPPRRRDFQRTDCRSEVGAQQEQDYSDQTLDGVEKGCGVFRNGKEQKGTNFAGNLIVIQWGCGAPCLRIAIVNARTGDVYYPPSINELGARSFDLPLLMIGDSVPQNPEVQLRPNSNLMIIRATPNLSGCHQQTIAVILIGFSSEC